ncbi:MAG: HU family DNA-binding protein [Succinivibrionaceae bacterium]
MTKIQLIENIAEKSKLSKKDSELALNAFIETVKETLAKGDEITLVGFGTFKTTARNARAGRNPKTGAAVEIPACKVPKFTPGKLLKEAVNV